ncbi:hypothetical protein BB561_003722 [Smittium simulii]|uniref:Uncharacterized protein n=1 Tax=Smittium simulii TaxID=133385 RepID=A0A2T9YJW9_9FUNG|nr:hypothetical protein BB561_003722 [Smittium simulii]
MNEATLQRIEELTEKVNQLLLARETVPAPITVTEPEDEFITTRAPASELKIYPMLKDALPSIEEDFFRIQLTEEERKDAIYSCPRNSITRHVKNLSGLIKRPPNTPIPKARAIGATLAATSGVPVENIVSHAFWSNYNMFDTYYRLDRSTQSNMTEAVLPLE